MDEKFLMKKKTMTDMKIVLNYERIAKVFHKILGSAVLKQSEKWISRHLNIEVFRLSYLVVCSLKNVPI